MEYKKRRSGSSAGARSVDGMMLPRRRYDMATSRPRPYTRPASVKPQVTQAARPISKPASPLHYKAAPALRPVKSRQRQKPRFRTPVFALAAFVIITIGFVAGRSVLADNKLTTAVSTVAVHAAAKASAANSHTAVPADADPLPTLSADMAAAAGSKTGVTAAATLIDLSNNRIYQAGPADKQLQAASTAKLVSVVTYLQKVEAGRASLGQKIGGVSAQTLIQRMIVNSDNDAWAKLNTAASYPTQTALLKSLSIDGVFTANGSNTLSTNGMARFLQLLYGGQLVNSMHLDLIKQYMSQTTNTNLIQAALPKDVTVYHKYGQLGNNLNDAAVFELNGTQYILVIYTQATSSSAAAAQADVIHAVTKAAYADISAN